MFCEYAHPIHLIDVFGAFLRIRQRYADGDDSVRCLSFEAVDRTPRQEDLLVHILHEELREIIALTFDETFDAPPDLILEPFLVLVDDCSHELNMGYKSV